MGGGHRDIFEHLNRLQERGHEVALYTLGERPEWFPLRAPVHSFEDYEELVAALAEQDAIKVATWWNTAAPVWRASVLRGIPVYFVQDIETSYYPDDERTRHAVLDSYRPEFHYMTISAWNRERLRELGLDAELIPPGIDLDDLPAAPGRGAPPRHGARARTLQPAEEPAADARRLARAGRVADAGERRSCACSGSSRSSRGEPGMRYVESPSDEQVNELFNQATVFVQTSTHEGFALPPLEAMATGGAVVCTDAHGNRDFCVDGENCLMPEPTPEAVTRGARAAAGRSGAARAARAGGDRDGQRLRVGAAHRCARGVPGGRRRAYDSSVTGSVVLCRELLVHVLLVGPSEVQGERLG